MSKLNAAITAAYGYVPDRVLTNAELEKVMDTSDEWILTRTGIKERRILGDGLATSDMCVEVIKGILESKNLTMSDIDLIICATATPDHIFPATINVAIDKLAQKYPHLSPEKSNTWGYDLSAACSSFLFALSTAAQFILAGTHKKVIVLGADKMSSIIDYEDRRTCILFGDGAGGVLIEANKEGLGIIDQAMYSDGAGRHLLYLKGGGSAYPASFETVANKEHFLYQEGQKVFKSAISCMSDSLQLILKRNNLETESIAYLLPHQANMRIIKAVCEKLGMPINKALITLDIYGNTTNASMPLTLFKHKDKLKKGDLMAFTAFGGGFAWGSLLLKWAY